MESVKIKFEDVFLDKNRYQKSEKKELPTLQCRSCGNCEKNYHNDPSSNINNGFCVKFFQNVGLDEKNVKCWTSKQNTYFEDLSKISPTEKNEDLHKRNKRAKHLNIEFNQPTLF